MTLHGIDHSGWKVGHRDVTSDLLVLDVAVDGAVRVAPFDASYIGGCNRLEHARDPDRADQLVPVAPPS